MASHESLHSDAVPVSGRSTAVPSGVKDGILSETIENRAQTPREKVVPSTYFEPVLRYWSQCWTGCAQQLGVKPALLDDLVGRDEERLRYGKPHRFGSSEIDAELELCFGETGCD